MQLGVVAYRAEWVTGDEVLGAADGFFREA